MNKTQMAILEEILSIFNRTQDIIFKLQQRIYELEKQVNAIVERIDND